MVEILPKNDPEKPSGSDADVSAKFVDLKTTYYVQVKHHKDETGVFGLEQIKAYMDYMKANPVDEYEINVGWFLTTADFSEEVRQKAREYREIDKVNIRLINGRDFVEMIFNAGIDLLDLIDADK